MSQLHNDKFAQIKVKKELIKKELKEVENDPLEAKVFNNSGECIANRDWKCNFKNCSYMLSRGQCLKLTVKAREEDRNALIGSQEFACLKHYRVKDIKSRDYCHNFYKLNKELPPNAKLNNGGQKPLPQLPQPITSSTFQEKPISGNTICWLLCLIT